MKFRYVRSSVWTVWTLGIILGTTGCGSYGGICTDAMDCLGGNDADIEACEIGLEADEDEASAYGCDPEWDDYYACYEDRARCDRNPDRFNVAPGDCDRETEDLFDCIDHGSRLR